jgi:hypothetical protein
MIKSLVNLFKSVKDSITIQKYGEHGLTRKHLGYFHGFIEGEHYEYYCECGTTLSEGPSGGMSINAVCNKCMINYGCLPGYFGDQS